MEPQQNVFQRLWHLWLREVHLLGQRPLLLVCIFFAPIGLLVFFPSLMKQGLPTDLPAGLVDDDNTSVSRQLSRILDSMEETDIRYHYANISEAREAMQRGEIYGFFHVPKGTTARAIGQRQPRVAFYTNEAYFVAGSLLMRDLRTISELSGMAMSRETFLAQGMTPDQAMAAIRPLVIEAHPIGNSTLNYSVYLSNILVPGCILLLVMIFTPYSIGMEWKNNTQTDFYRMAGNSSTIALTGKLFPQTLLFTLMMMLTDVVFYKFLDYPCNCPIGMMMIVGALTVLAAQGFGAFLFGLFQGQMRMAMCIGSLWGVVSFSICGFSFPVMAMDPTLQVFAWLFPLRHYYLLYVNLALHGYPLLYVWPSLVAFACFFMLPIAVLPLYRYAFKHATYKP